MTKKEKLDLLIKVADFLDRNGELELANMTDSLISEEASLTDLDLEIPEEEYDILKEIYEALGRSL